MQALIKHNAYLIKELHDRVHQTFREKPHGPEHTKACAEFHTRYDSLAFPGGYETGLQNISRGDPAALEAAICFLEAEPYFFRSQYIKTKLTRLLKHAELSKSQQTRLENVLRRQKNRTKPSSECSKAASLDRLRQNDPH